MANYGDGIESVAAGAEEARQAGRRQSEGTTVLKDMADILRTMLTVVTKPKNRLHAMRIHRAIAQSLGQHARLLLRDPASNDRVEPPVDAAMATEVSALQQARAHIRLSNDPTEYQLGDITKAAFKLLAAQGTPAIASEGAAVGGLQLHYLYRVVRNVEGLVSNFDGLTRELVMPLAEGDEKFKEHITASKKQARKELMKIIRQAREEMGRLILQSEPRMKACFRSIGTAKWRSEEMLKAVVIENIHVQLNAIAEWSGKTLGMEQDDIKARLQKVAEACLFELVDIYTEEILNGKRWEGGFGAGEKRVEVAQAVFQDAQHLIDEFGEPELLGGCARWKIVQVELNSVQAIGELLAVAAEAFADTALSRFTGRSLDDPDGFIPFDQAALKTAGRVLALRDFTEQQKQGIRAELSRLAAASESSGGGN